MNDRQIIQEAQKTAEYRQLTDEENKAAVDASVRLTLAQTEAAKGLMMAIVGAINEGHDMPDNVTRALLNYAIVLMTGKPLYK